MSVSRRDFVHASIVAGGSLAAGYPRAPARPDRYAARPVIESTPHPLTILVVGGTSFIGPHLIHYALQRGHTVTTFTRGRTVPTIHPDQFRHVEALIGDRANDHSALRGRTWDVVIDTSGWRLEWAVNSTEALRDSTDFYLYTSSIGVYHPYRGADITEDAEVRSEDPSSVPENRRPTYGVMKVLSEQRVLETFGDQRTTVVRPGYIVGPGDTFDRFPYWPLRLEMGGEVLVPGPDDPVQYTEVRDLAEFMVRLVEQRRSGTYNVVGPPSPLEMSAFVHGVHAAVSSEITWVPVADRDFLEQHEVRFIAPWVMPVGDSFGTARINVDRARAAGLTFRPLADIARDTLRWWHSDAVTAERRERAWAEGFAMNPAREREILRAWRARGG